MNIAMTSKTALVIKVKLFKILEILPSGLKVAKFPSIIIDILEGRY